MILVPYRILLLVFVVLLRSYCEGQRHFSKLEYSGPNNDNFPQQNAHRPFLNYQHRFPGDYEQGENYGRSNYESDRQGPTNGINRRPYRRRNGNLRPIPTLSNYEEPPLQQLQNQRQNRGDQYIEGPDFYPSQNQDRDSQYDSKPNLYLSQNQKKSGYSQYNQDPNFYPPQNQTSRQNTLLNQRRQPDWNEEYPFANTHVTQKLKEFFSTIQTLNDKLNPILQQVKLMQNSIQRIEQQTKQQQQPPLSQQSQNQPQQLDQPSQKNQSQQQMQDKSQQEPSPQQKDFRQSSPPGLLNFFIASPTPPPAQLQEAQTKPQSSFKFLPLLNIPVQ